MGSSVLFFHNNATIHPLNLIYFTFGMWIFKDKFNFNLTMNWLGYIHNLHDVLKVENDKIAHERNKKNVSCAK